VIKGPGVPKRFLDITALNGCAFSITNAATARITLCTHITLHGSSSLATGKRELLRIDKIVQVSIFTPMNW